MSMFYELMMRKKTQIMYATIKGSLTENDGVFSGFSGTNYLQLQNQFTLSPTTKAEFNFKINISSLTSNNAIFGSITNYGLYVGINSSGNLELFVGDNSSWVVTKTGTTTLSTSTDYDIKLNINNNVATLYIDGNIELTANLGLISSNTYDIGVGRGITTSDYFRGSVDLNNSYIKLGTKYKLQAVVGYTVVGSPTISDGVVSGFSSANYLNLGANVPYSNNFEMVFKFTTGTIGSTQAIFEGTTSNTGATIIISANGKLFVSAGNGHWIVDTAGTTVLSANTTYYVKFSYKNNVYKLELSTDNVNWNTEISVESSSTISTTSNKSIGYSTRFSGRVFTGSIDMNNTYIKINNKLWFNGQQA